MREINIYLKVANNDCYDCDFFDRYNEKCLIFNKNIKSNDLFAIYKPCDECQKNSVEVANND